MTKIVTKPNSGRDGDKWVPEGLVFLDNGIHQRDSKESCKDAKFDTKEEADRYFMQACNRKYRIKN